MKKFLSVTLIFFTIIFSGCSGTKNLAPPKSDSEAVTKQDAVVEKKIYAGSEQRSCFVIKNLEDIDDFLAAAHERDGEYIGRIPWAGKGFFIDEDVRVLCDESKAYRGMVFVTILEGKFKDYSGYTFSKRVRKVKKAPA